MKSLQNLLSAEPKDGLAPEADDTENEMPFAIVGDPPKRGAELQFARLSPLPY